MNVCTSRPDCPCAFCILSRTQPSAGDEERRLAEAFIEDFCRRRDRQMDREAWKAGVLPRKVDAEFLELFPVT